MWEEVVSSLPDPVVLRRLLFAATVIPAATPRYIELISNFAFESSLAKPPYKNIRVLLENLEFLNDKAFVTDKQLIKEVVSVNDKSKEHIGITLISPNTSCKLCGSKLIIRGDRPASVTLYTDDMGTVPGRMYRKYCSSRHKGCPFTQHYGFYCFGDKELSEAVADNDWDKLPYFVSTSQTAFAMTFLEKFDAELLLGQISYKQKSDIYNYYHGYETTKKKQFARSRLHTGPESDEEDDTIMESADPEDLLCERVILDRRRLEEAHLRYSVLKMYQRYSADFPKWSISTNVKKMLEEVTPTFYKVFSAYYSTHKCNYPGCNEVMILDGNMKNRRDICAASEAGYIEYPSLPGSIKSGCQLSPLRNSKYCFQHAPRVSKQSLHRNPDSESEESASQDNQEGLVKFITGKKVTRSTVYYQVAWIGNKETITWELASTLPEAIVSEFEAGLSATEEIALSSPKYGVVSHTIVTSTQSPAPAKRMKTDSLPVNEGAFEEDPSSSKLTCNTQKDKVRLHHRTAGVLAGMWPCGIVVMLSELFTSESITQVYASLHQLLSDHDVSRLKFICYDDGCHLRRYASHPSRRDLTPNTKFLSNIEIVIDKMHMAGHIDPWCAEHCNPKSFRELDNVDTEVCEQHFSWLSKYSRITRKMTRDVFVFFILNLIDLHNRREERKLHRSKFM